MYLAALKTINGTGVNGDYPITIGKNLDNSIPSLIADVKAPCKTAIISDNTVFPLYGHKIKALLEYSGYSVCAFVFPSGESSKTMETIVDILNFFAENGLSRSDLVVALGGGVVGDMTGFAASIYMRGLD